LFAYFNSSIPAKCPNQRIIRVTTNAIGGSLSTSTSWQATDEAWLAQNLHAPSHRRPSTDKVQLQQALAPSSKSVTPVQQAHEHNLLEKLTVAKPVKNSLVFMEAQGSLSCPQVPANGIELYIMEKRGYCLNLKLKKY
jgi:hypothetical protein